MLYFLYYNKKYLFLLIKKNKKITFTNLFTIIFFFVIVFINEGNIYDDWRKDSVTRTFYGVNNKYGDLNDYEYTMDNINDAMMKYMNK